MPKMQFFKVVMIQSTGYEAVVGVPITRPKNKESLEDHIKGKVLEAVNQMVHTGKFPMDKPEIQSWSLRSCDLVESPVIHEICTECEGDGVYPVHPGLVVICTDCKGFGVVPKKEQ